MVRMPAIECATSRGGGVVREAEATMLMSAQQPFTWMGGLLPPAAKASFMRAATTSLMPPAIVALQGYHV